MAIVRRLLYRCRVPLITIAGSMLATADASAREIVCKDACAVQTSLQPWADPLAMPYAAGGYCAARRGDGVHDSVPSPVAVDRRADGAGSVGRSTMRPARSSRLRLEAEEWDDRTDGDDDTDVPVRGWLRDMVRTTDVIPAESDSRSDLIDTPTVSSLLYQQLRC
jgi:hypothetical protein